MNSGSLGVVEKQILMPILLNEKQIIEKFMSCYTPEVSSATMLIRNKIVGKITNKKKRINTR